MNSAEQLAAAENWLLAVLCIVRDQSILVVANFGPGFSVPCADSAPSRNAAARPL